jgi:hypothetical protein
MAGDLARNHLDIGELTGPPLPDAEWSGFNAEQFRESFGEDLGQTLDLATWRTDVNLTDEYQRIETEVRLAVEKEGEYQRHIRRDIFPRLQWGDVPGCGKHEIPLADIESVHRGLLFNGGVEACDGTNQDHDTLPLTIHQIGVSLVSYAGDRGTWRQRLFRRDLRLSNRDPVEEVLELLERRGRRAAVNHSNRHDAFSELFQRALMSYAERAILLHHAKAVWRMGHGSPAPLELLTGGGLVELMVQATRIVRELVEQQQKFVFVASEPKERALMTIGQALHPLEYAIVQTLEDRIAHALDMVHFGDSSGADLRWDGERLTPQGWLARFRDQVAPRVVVGVYRASLIAPPQVFYAHADHADVAARIAVADSVLQQERGFPLLIDLADRVCGSIYGGGSLHDLTAAAYAARGVPWRYLSERATRHPH